MRLRGTLLPAVTLTLAVGACAQSRTDDRSGLPGDAAAFVTSFQETARAHLNSIDSRLDTARAKVSDLGRAVPVAVERKLDELASRSNELERRIRTLAWRGEAQWDSTTREIEAQLDRLRADVAIALRGDDVSEGDAGLEPPRPGASDLAHTRRQ